MNINYDAPFQMSDTEREAALKLLAGKKITILSDNRVDGTLAAAKLVRETAEHFGATHSEVNQDVFIHINCGRSLPYQFSIGANASTTSMIRESSHNELTARILMCMCYFIKMRDAGKPLPVMSDSEIETAKQGGNGCFIATACLGSQNHPDVIELRQFRNQYLCLTAAGKFFISVYYQISPRIANWLSRHGLARLIVSYLVVRPAVLIIRFFSFLVHS